MYSQTAFGIALVVASIIIAIGAVFSWANHDIAERTVRQGLKLQQQQGKLPPDLQNADIEQIDLEDREIDVELPSGVLLRNNIAVFLANLWYLWAPAVLLVCFVAALFSSSSKRDSEQFSLRRARFLTLIVLIVVIAAAIALANLTSEAVTDDLIKTIDPVNMPERAYGWPLTWYWRMGASVPGTIRIWSGGTRPQLQWPVSRYSAARLSADLAIWLMMLAASSTGCRRLLRRYQPQLRWRPRVSTLFVFIIVLAPTLLANLSFDVSPLSSLYFGWRDVTVKASYGWPLIWHWYFVAPWYNLYGWDYSTTRLAANLVIWLAMLAVVVLTWEWLLRRFRPRLRFSLRTMLAAVMLAAVVCAWVAMARNRAREQDALIAWAKPPRGVVWVERWGPKWLDLVGADPFRRCVIGARLSVEDFEWYAEEAEEEQGAEHEAKEPNDAEAESPENDDEESDADEEFNAEIINREQEELLRRLARLRGLRFLDIKCGLLTPGMAAALSDLRQLRMMRIDCEGEAPPGRTAWVGKLTGLERLWLRGVRRDDLAFLGELTNLQSLTLDISEGDEDAAATQECVAVVGKLRQLERLFLTVRRDDLAYLGGLTNLKSLALDCANVRATDLAHLRSLTNLKSLKLDLSHFGGDREEISKCVAAVGKLTQLERLYLIQGEVHRDDLAHLGGLTNLKSLTFSLNDYVTDDAGLAELAPLDSLEELTIDSRVATAAGLESLIALKWLKTVHIAALEMNLAESTIEAVALRRALESLRKSHPGIVIDSDYSAGYFAEGDLVPWRHGGRYEILTDRTDLDSFLRLVILGP